jgi:hypothetical protein
LKHIVLGYKIDDEKLFCIKFFDNSCRVFHVQIVLHI